MDWENAVTVFKGIALFEFKEMKMGLLTRTSFSVCFHIPRVLKKEGKKRKGNWVLWYVWTPGPCKAEAAECGISDRAAEDGRESAGRYSLGCFLQCLWLKSWREVFSRRGAAMWCQFSCSDVLWCFTCWHSRTVHRPRNSHSLCWALDPSLHWGLELLSLSWGRSVRKYLETASWFQVCLCGFAVPPEHELLEFWAGLGL